MQALQSIRIADGFFEMFCQHSHNSAAALRQNPIQDSQLGSIFSGC